MLFDEETESLLDRFVTEFMEAVRDERLILHEGCVVVTAPVGAPPEYIEIVVDGINDPNVLWRGVPPTLGIGDVVTVWENTVSHRREILGASGATGSSIPLGVAHEFFKMNAAGTGMGFEPFDWDEASAPPGADVVHDHSAAAEGGQNLDDIALFTANDNTLLTIAVGAITKTQIYHRVANEGGAGGDDLDTINGAVGDGDLLIIRPAISGTTLTVKHGTGNIWLGNLQDMVLGRDHVCLILIYISGLLPNPGWAGLGWTGLSEHTHASVAAGGSSLHELARLGLIASSNLTIAAGSVTKTQSLHLIDTQGGAATDDLDTIAGANNREFLVIAPVSGARTIVVKHNTGNIWNLGGTDISLDDAEDLLLLFYAPAVAKWIVINGVGAGGGGTLDQAYDFGGAGAGRTIAVDTGAVQMQAPDATQYALELQREDADTTASLEVLRLIRRVAAGVGADWLGAHTGVNLENDAGAEIAAGLFGINWETAAAGSEGARFSVQLDQGGLGVGAAADLYPRGWAADTYSWRVRNSSGGAVVAGNVGYVSNGEFYTTVTAYLDAAWFVVLVGGANGDDIYVINRGRVAVILNGNCNANDYLYTSTTAGQAQPQSYMRPEMLAIAKTANAGGAGGTCEAVLYCHTKLVAIADANYLLSVTSSGGSDFTALIDDNAGAHGGQALDATHVPFDTISSGAHENITPGATTELGKLRLYNSTRATYRLITSVNAANHWIGTVNTVDAWADNDSITIQSQTCVAAGPPYYVDIDLSQSTTVIPVVTRVLAVGAGKYDAVAGNYLITHPWEIYGAPKAFSVINQRAGWIWGYTIVSLNTQRFCIFYTASGAASQNLAYTIRGAYVATP